MQNEKKIKKKKPGIVAPACKANTEKTGHTVLLIKHTVFKPSQLHIYLEIVKLINFRDNMLSNSAWATILMCFLTP